MAIQKEKIELFLYVTRMSILINIKNTIVTKISTIRLNIFTCSSYIRSSI